MEIRLFRGVSATKSKSFYFLRRGPGPSEAASEGPLNERSKTARLFVFGADERRENGIDDKRNHKNVRDEVDDCDSENDDDDDKKDKKKKNRTKHDEFEQAIMNNLWKQLILRKGIMNDGNTMYV